MTASLYYTSARGIPRQLDPSETEQAFRCQAESLDVSCAAAPSLFIAIDGKTLRQSFDYFADRKAAHVLSAFAIDHRIILAHEVIDEKSNEIRAVQALIGAMGLSDRVFTLDAMHCQKKPGRLCNRSTVSPLRGVRLMRVSRFCR
ncbi:ISAs1 family transposase [Methylocystis sp.]|uniref:ISAs1 family transposase n=1 Tax=Methylocystis sp. TaxID=1911079 RepID=UPI0025FDAB97|nr:ISAs1 family transposase [Methylocystis sp.]